MKCDITRPDPIGTIVIYFSLKLQYKTEKNEIKEVN